MERVTFLERTTAERNLARVQASSSPEIARLLPTLLRDLPDPDSAINLFERLCAEASPRTMELLLRQTSLVHYAVALFSYSQYLGEALLQNQDLFESLASKKNIEHVFGREEYDSRWRGFASERQEADIAALLSRFKKREYIRILLRDALNVAPLAEVTAEISALADVLIQQALFATELQMRQRFSVTEMSGSGPGFCVLALGKLGGNELNYSSDVDLLYLFSDEPALEAQIPWREFCIRLAQHTTGALSRATAEGAAFRIDLRLRPRGAEGEPALPLMYAIRYYLETAQDWELQALIKARWVAGDEALARAFIKGVEPRVYRKGLNFSAIDTALRSAEKIRMHRARSRAVHRAGTGIDVKLDPGGIRDIEFLAQCLQRVYGGEESWLRSCGTLLSLQKLHDKRHISGNDFHELTHAYEFLRRLEHRRQLRRGQQVHRLPDSETELKILERSLGSAPQNEGANLDVNARVREHMQRVNEIYQRIIHAQKTIRERTDAERRFALVPALTVEQARDGSYEQLLERLSLDSPELHQIAARRDLSARSRRLLHRFLSSALTSSERYAAVLRSAPAVEKALTIFECSDFLSDILIRHPAEISTVDAAVVRQYSDHPGLELDGDYVPSAEPAFEFAATAKISYDEKLALLRRHFRHRTFALGISDVLSLQPVFESLEGTTDAAESAIASAHAIAAEKLADPGLSNEFEFCVVGLGRLGAREFDFGSDADVLFVRGENWDSLLARRLAEQIVEVLATYTKEGTVFAVDTRLRPMGSEGELVTTPSALRSYFDLGGDAQTWEGLSFTKMRTIAGSVALGRRASVAVRTASERFAGSPAFAERIRGMRKRLVHASSDSNFKTAAGGFYDLDFIIGYFLLRHRLSFEGGNTRRRLHALAGRGVLSDEDCATLDYAAELLRSAEHAIRLFSGRARAVLPHAEHARECVERMTSKMVGKELSGSLEAELQQVAASVREIFDRLIV